MAAMLQRIFLEEKAAMESIYAGGKKAREHFAGEHFSLRRTMQLCGKRP